MYSPNLIRSFSVKAITALVLAFSACAAGRADTVFDNLTTQPLFGQTVGTSVGASLLLGNSAVNLTYLVFPQLNSADADAYVSGETFTINLRNADGTVGLPLYSGFTLSNDPTSGQTDVIPVTPVVLLANTGYWFIVSTASSTSWDFTQGTAYTSFPGVTQPADDVAYKVNSSGSTYFSLADGPQLYHIEGTATLAPEPSSFCLLTLLGAGVFLFMRRRARPAPVA